MTNKNYIRNFEIIAQNDHVNHNVKETLGLLI